MYTNMTAKAWIASVGLGFRLFGSVYAQEKPVKTREDHLRKAKRAKTTAFIAGGLSVVCFTGGIIYGNKDREGIGETLGHGIKSVMFDAVGVTSGPTCIGFAIGSGYHRRKAAIPSLASGRPVRSVQIGVRVSL